jgi:hypothetical protein
MQAIVMHAPSGRVRIPQRSLRQTSPTGQIVGPRGTPYLGGSQNSAGQKPPSGAQMPQLSLQQYSPGPQALAPHGSKPHSWFEHRMPSAMQMPPHCGQQCVPGRQRMAAQGFPSIGTQ